MTDGQVMDPTRGAARLHDDQIKLVVLEDRREIIAVCGGGQEFVFSGFGVKKAAHGIELAKIECENFHSLCPSGLGWNECDSDGCDPQGSERSKITGPSRQILFK